MILHSCSFQNYASHRGRGALFPKNAQDYQKRGVQSTTVIKKIQMAHEIYKIACVWRTVVFVDGTLEAENAQVTSGKQIFDERRKRIKREPNEQRSEMNEHSEQNMLYPLDWGVQKVGFLMQNAVVRFSKICFPPRVGSTFS